MAASITEREADVVIVGARIVGCATAYYLARRGVRAVVVERAAAAGEQSRKNWGFVCQQGRDPVELPMLATRVGVKQPVIAKRLAAALQSKVKVCLEQIDAKQTATPKRARKRVAA